MPIKCHPTTRGLGGKILLSRTAIRNQIYLGAVTSNFPFLRAAAVVAFIGAMGPVGQARAEFTDGDVVKFTAGAGVAYDDNVFRLPNGVNPDVRTGSTARGDTIFTLNAGAAVNKDVSRQNFVLGADIVQGLYMEHTDLTTPSTILGESGIGKSATNLAGRSAIRRTSIPTHSSMFDRSSKTSGLLGYPR